MLHPAGLQVHFANQTLLSRMVFSAIFLPGIELFWYIRYFHLWIRCEYLSHHCYCNYIYSDNILFYGDVDLSKCQKAKCDVSTCQLKPVSTSSSLTPGVFTHCPSFHPFSIVYLSSTLTCAFHSCQTWSGLAGSRTWVSAWAGNGRESCRAARLLH